MRFDNNQARDGPCAGRDVYCETCGDCPKTWNACGVSVQCGTPCRELWSIPLLIGVGAASAYLGWPVLRYMFAQEQRVAAAVEEETLPSVRRRSSVQRRASSFFVMQEGDNLNTAASAGSVATLILLASLALSRMTMTFEIGIEWGLVDLLFGWVRISVKLPRFLFPHVPDSAMTTLELTAWFGCQILMFARLLYFILVPMNGWTTAQTGKINLVARAIAAFSGVVGIVLMSVGLSTGSGLTVGLGLLIFAALGWALVTTALRWRWKRVAHQNYPADRAEAVYWEANIKSEVSVQTRARIYSSSEKSTSSPGRRPGALVYRDVRQLHQLVATAHAGRRE